MGLFSDFKALKDVRRTKAGGTAKLSAAQITCMVVSIPEAKYNLSAREFLSVYELYRQMRKDRKKTEMDLNEYYSAAVEIIKKFDAIAPYEKYKGGSEADASVLVEKLRKFSDA